MREYCRRGKNRNSKMEMVRHQTEKSDIQILPPFNLYPWINLDSEPPSSSISSKPPRGCLLFTAVEVRVGVGGMLFRGRLSSWDEEVSSLCPLEESAKMQIDIL